MLLLAAAGLQNKENAKHLEVDHMLVVRWRERYLDTACRVLNAELPHGAPLVKVDIVRLAELTMLE